MPITYSPFIADLKEKMELEGPFLVKVLQLQIDKNGRPYINLVLMDKSGELEARIWERSVEIADKIKSNDIVRVAGKINSYQGRKQIVVEAIEKAPEGSYSLDRFLPCSAYSTDQMYSELVSLFSTLSDPHLLELAKLTLNDAEIKKKILRAPAAKSVHHAYVGGLLEHMLSVCRLLDFLSIHYNAYYGGCIKRDFLLLGGLFHDLGKIHELNFDRTTEYSKEGQLIGHLIIGCEIIEKMSAQISGFPREHTIELKHLVLSHHGKYEYGSPRLPMTIEAWIVHYMDDLDSKINSILGLMGTDQNLSEWTPMLKLYERPFLKPKVKPKMGGLSPGRQK